MRNDIGFKVDARLEKRDEDGSVVHTRGGHRSRVGGGKMGSPGLGARVGGGGGRDKKGVTNVRLQTEVYILHPPPLEGGGGMYILM